MGGGQFKAFTLIELLAIIVILAIIAVITIPIILNVIDNANKGSIIDSAYGYKDAISKYYLERLSSDTNFKLDSGSYIVNDDGSIMSIDTENREYGSIHNIQISGTKPSGGYFEYQDSRITNGCLTIDEYKVTIEDGEMKSAEKGACKETSLTACNSENFQPSPIEWFTFNDSSNPGKITGFSSEYDGTTKITIPCYKSDGTKITHIGYGGLSGRGLTSVTIPDTVTTIYEGYLNGNAIEELILGNGLEEVSAGSLSVLKLTKLSLPQNLKTIGNGAFTSGQLEEVVLNRNIETINFGFFQSNNKLNKVVNNTGKALDWNFMFGNLSDEPFVKGTVTKGDRTITITSDSDNVSHPQKQIVYKDDNGIRYYNAEWVGQNPVYFDPTGNDTNCSANHYNKTGKTGCMKWYAYGENADGTVNMILDHNTTPKLAWVTSDDYNVGGAGVGITYPSGTTFGSYGSNGNWDKGPITLLNQLKEDTSAWAAVSTRSDIYTNSNSYNNSGTAKERFTINYSGYKARLITAQEVADISGYDFDEKTSTNYFDIKLDAMWLLNNLSASNTDEYPYGYWTASPDAAGNSGYAWSVYHGSYIGSYNFVSNSRYYGARPVIAVSKSVVFGS